LGLVQFKLRERGETEGMKREMAFFFSREMERKGGEGRRWLVL